MFQELSRPGRVPPGGRVRAGDQDNAVGLLGSQPETGIDARRRIQENVMVLSPGLLEHGSEGRGVHLIGGGIHRRGEEKQLLKQGVRLYLIEGIAAGQNVQKRQAGAVGQAQGDIQIPQAYIAVDSHNPCAQLRQSCGNTGADGSFACSALTGKNSDQFSHRLFLLITD